MGVSIRGLRVTVPKKRKIRSADLPAPKMSDSRRIVLGAFWTISALLLLYVIVSSDFSDPLVALAAVGVMVTALIPSYLWCSGRAHGWPIFPAMAATYIVTFSLPLLSANPAVQMYSADARLEAAVTALTFLVIGTMVWLFVVRRPPEPLPPIRMIRPDIGAGWFLRILGVAAAYSLVHAAGWSQALLPAGVVTIMNSGSITLTTVAIAVLASNAGAGKLTQPQMTAFVTLGVSVLVINAVSLLLVGAMLIAFIGLASYTLGRGRPPFRTLAAVLVVFAILHSGKHAMRDKYWAETQSVAPWEYPGRLADWFVTGIASLDPDSKESDASRDARHQSLGQRAALVQMTLLVQDQAPRLKPFLFGETYAVVPALLVPRVFWADKPAAHEGTTLLSTYFGLQNRENTGSTTIGFGLLAESFANFGYAGVAALALLLGWIYGAVARWAASAPTTSMRGLLALMTLGTSIQTEFTAGVFISSTFQGAAAIATVAVILMRRSAVDGTDRPAPGIGSPVPSPS